MDYNWLITDADCVPTKIYEYCDGKEYCWLLGEALSQVVRNDNSQWVWAVLSGFKKDIALAEILKYPLPYADGYKAFWTIWARASIQKFDCFWHIRRRLTNLELKEELLHMEYINVTKANLEKEHICCAISNNKDVQVSSKKEWLSERMDDGLVFLKSVERGKCFIEYIPAENAWVPIAAEGYMVINCLWVSGAFKGNGYSSDLLEQCIADSKEKGKKGLCILSAAKKKPFLADPKFLAYKGFSICDESDNGIQLWYLPFGKETARPQFKECAKHPHVEESGYVLYYTSQCPFNAKYVPILQKTAKEKDIPFHAIHITSKEAAQSAPTPITTYALFYDGAYLTNEVLNDKKFEKMVKG